MKYRTRSKPSWNFKSHYTTYIIKHISIIVQFSAFNVYSTHHDCMKYNTIGTTCYITADQSSSLRLWPFVLCDFVCLVWLAQVGVCPVVFPNNLWVWAWNVLYFVCNLLVKPTTICQKCECKYSIQYCFLHLFHNQGCSRPFQVMRM